MLCSIIVHWLINNTRTILSFLIQYLLSILAILMEAPPSSWIVLCLPEEQGSKVLMAVDSNMYELDAFQAKSKVVILLLSIQGQQNWSVFSFPT